MSAPCALALIPTSCGKGLACKADVAFGDEVLFIPRDQMWTAESVLCEDPVLRKALESLVRRCEKSLEAGCPSLDGVPLVEFVAASDFVLSCSLLRKASDQLRGFVEQLPTHVPSALDCEDEFRAIGSYARAEKIARMNQRRRRRFNWMQEHIFESGEQPQSVFRSAGAEAGSSFSAEEWEWAERIISSRAFEGPFSLKGTGSAASSRVVGRLRPHNCERRNRHNDPQPLLHQEALEEQNDDAGVVGFALAPFMEYFNHREKDTMAEPVAEYWFDSVRDGLVVRAPLRDSSDSSSRTCWAAAGQEVFIRYSEMSHWRFAKYYGFVPRPVCQPHPTLDEFPLRPLEEQLTSMLGQVLAQTSAPQQALVRDTLRTLMASSSAELTASLSRAACCVTSMGPNDRLCAILRLQCISTLDDLARFPQSGFGQKSLSDSNELMTLQLLALLLVEQQRQRTASQNASEDWKSALVQQVAAMDQTILKRCAESVDTQINRLRERVASMQSVRPSQETSPALAVGAKPMTARDRFRALSGTLLGEEAK